MKRMLSMLLCLAMVLTWLPAHAHAEEDMEESAPVLTEPMETGASEPREEEPVLLTETKESQSLLLEGEALTQEDLYNGYVESLFYGSPVTPFGTGSNSAGARLTGDEKAAYDGMVAVIKKIAAGQRESTCISLGPVNSDVIMNFDGTIQEFDWNMVKAALRYDLAYEMYWFGYVTSLSYYENYDGNLLQLTFEFYVDPMFRKASGDPFLVDGTKAAAAVKASQYAKSIVSKYAAEPEYNRLVGYKNEICALNTYNDEAAEDSSYGDRDNGPWQLVYVFDRNPNTNVVCEGYSKAFQYLCDMGGTVCYTVGGYTSGPHAWNIVTLEGKNYLVDITNSEEGTWGADGSLFLAGGTGSAAKGYRFTNSYGNYIYYLYDWDMEEIWGTKVLTLASTSYCPCTHAYTSQVTKEPTEYETGTRTYTCLYCGRQYTETIPALPHTTHKYTSKVTKSATCTKSGVMTYTCPCGHSYQEEIPPKDHVTHVVRPSKAATCTATGLTEKIKCKVCNLVIQGQTVIPALGHDYVNYYCTRCGLDDPNMPIPDHVDRVSGKDRHETAFQIANLLKQVLGIEKFDTILIASGSDSADALAGSYLAIRKNAPILLSRGNSHQRNLEYIQANLASGGIVYILGGTGAVPQEMENLLIQNGIVYQRLKGANRFDTNLAILDKAVVDGDEILVSTGYNFADSLSASATGKPMLLVNTTANVLTEAQKTWLEGQRGKTFTIIGGTSAVSEELEAALGEYGTTLRLKGSGREATSVEVAKRYFTTPSAALLAYSRNFPDGLCGGPLAYNLGAPLLLVNAGVEAPARDYVAANGIAKGYILGGASAVSGTSARIVFGE